MNVALIFKSTTLAKSIGEYLGIIESVSKKIDRLAQSEFEAGMRALEQAARANKEQKSLLREARNRFNKAISLEKSERLALSYLGLALCHYYLQDYENCNLALQDILAVRIDGLVMSLVTSDNPMLWIIMGAFGYYVAMGMVLEEVLLNSRKKNLKELQESVEKILNSGF